MIRVNTCSTRRLRDPAVALPPAAVDDFSGDWTPAREWQVPGPLTGTLETAIGDTGGSAPRVPYPDSDVPPRYALGGSTRLAAIWPERGRFTTTSARSEPFTVNYQYGFSSTIGAGPYDRNLLGDPPATVGRETRVTGGRVWMPRSPTPQRRAPSRSPTH